MNVLISRDHTNWFERNDLGQRPLYLAAAAGHQDVTERLLQQQVKINVYGGKSNYPLHAAYFGGYVHVVKL